MRLRRWGWLAVGVFAVGIALVTFHLLKPEKTPPPKKIEKSSTKSIENTEQEKRIAYKDCLDEAEFRYRRYVTTHGISATNNYSEEFYSLSDEEENTINATRATAYMICFNKYGG